MEIKLGALREDLMRQDGKRHKQMKIISEGNLYLSMNKSENIFSLFFWCPRAS
jgi:hypothetical protein